MKRFPWAEVMAVGMGQLRLSPRDFWAATPREIAAAFPKRTGAAPSRGALAELLQQYPDET